MGCYRLINKRLKAYKQLELLKAALAVREARATSSNAHLVQTAKAACFNQQRPLRTFQHQAGHRQNCLRHCIAAASILWLRQPQSHPLCNSATILIVALQFPKLLCVINVKFKEFIMKPRVGDWVEVRSKEEVLATLDKNGRLEGLPFMPQMLQYCGQKFQIYKRAHKTCDTVSGAVSGKYVSRQISDTVHLEHRCDGQAYGGCQADCLIFWKEAWLKTVGGDAGANIEPCTHVHSPTADNCTVDDIWKGTREQNGEIGKKIKFTCQATQLLNYSAPLKWWDPRQYVEDYRSGNASLAQIFNVFVYVGFVFLTLAPTDRLGRPARWVYDRFQALRGGTPYPRRKGTLPVGQPFPTASLNLQPGDLVRVKSYHQILATIDSKLTNLGLNWAEEMVPYCGRTYRVRARVENFIDEKSGILKKLKTPAIILEGVICHAYFSGKRWLCPRSIFPWWREAWLERVTDTISTSE